MKTLNVTSYSCMDPKAFHKKKTSFFTIESNPIPLIRLMQSRLGYKTIPVGEKYRAVEVKQSSYNSKPVDLIVTDDPHEILANISPRFLEQKFNLAELIERATITLGITPTNWKDIHGLSSEDKSILLTEPLMMKCQKMRISDAKFLGYIKLSFEEFGNLYGTIITDDMVYAFPKEKHDTLMIVDEGMTNRNMTLTYADHNGDGTETAWLRYNDGVNQNSIWTGDMGTIFKTDDVIGITEKMEGYLKDFNRPGYKIASPVVDSTLAPSFLKNMRYQQLIPETSFDLSSITKFAKELGLKNFSTKTKAELSIMIGEHLAAMNPEDLNPGLIFTSDTAPNLSDIETLTTDNPAYLKSNHLNIRDYYIFTSRIIGNCVYAPHASGSAAGRTPTDGTFTGYYGVTPLDFLG